MAICLLPALGFAGEVAYVPGEGPYDIQTLKDFQKNIVNRKPALDTDWCSPESPWSRIFATGSCKSRLISEKLEEDRLYYAVTGKPSDELSVASLSDSTSFVGIMSTESRESVAMARTSTSLQAALDTEMNGESVTGNANSRSYNDRLAFLVETDSSGKVLDLLFHIFYDTDGFISRGLTPTYSNFGNVIKYMEHVKKHYQGMEFADVRKLILDSGMKIETETESQVTFITPVNPLNPGISIEAMLNTVEWRSGILLNPAWPDYARIRKSTDGLIFETSVNGNSVAWEAVQ